MFEKFNFDEDTQVYNNDRYILVIKLEYGKMRVRKVDFVED